MARKNQNTNTDLNLNSMVFDLLSTPTAPFRESWVLWKIERFAAKLKLNIWSDRVGNLWLGAKNKTDVTKAQLVFVAHTDHPGFVVEDFNWAASGTATAVGKWLGGGPTNEKKLLNHGVRLFSHAHSALIFDGKITKVVPKSAGSIAGASMELKLSPSEKTLFSKGSFRRELLHKHGPWGACLWFKGEQVRLSTCRPGILETKAADDLAGVAAIIYAYAKAGRPKGVVALLSRAEESGFHGTMDVLESGLLSAARTTIVSIETSSQLPGAVQGAGPVVRCGDRSSVFHPGATKWIQNAAEFERGPKEAIPQDKRPQSSVVRYPGNDASSGGSSCRSFTFQRRVMDGGSCEGSAFNAYGFVVGAISIPLGGYHNVGPKKEPVLESIAWSDVVHTTQLLQRLMKDANSAHPSRLKQGGAFATFKKAIVSGYRQSRHLFK